MVPFQVIVQRRNFLKYTKTKASERLNNSIYKKASKKATPNLLQLITPSFASREELRLPMDRLLKSSCIEKFVENKLPPCGLLWDAF
jgi:hypothetical protein